ncbi:helix-turn-helix transcriptional regulator [Pseudokineococcus sp. 1T1Z-3]|uniref:helix-turn-helix transcriptional regulator n=1 Tax=Pseudokineococcus sp. 1T1Z-3 TaxID=3132745 RepID=UPI0030A1E06E
MAAAQRTERLLNLVIALLSTRRWLQKAQIRQAVPQYAEARSDEAFDRMFERDKEELRDLGVPLVTGAADAWFDDEPAYRVDREAWELPAIDVTPAELAVLGLAARVWQQASLAGPASRALVKLRALGVEPDDASLVGVEPRVRTAEPAFGPLYAATRDKAPVAFAYRTGSTGETARRTVEPWAITSCYGRWYLVGYDLDRRAPRVFRLDRVASGITRTGAGATEPVPADLDARALVRGRTSAPAERTASLALTGSAGAALRLRAGAPADAQQVEVPFADVEELADEVAGLGADVRVLAPPDLAEAVVARWRAVLAAHAAPGAAS